MTVAIKTGPLNDFFASAEATAREIDEGCKVSRKNTIWIEAKDLFAILKPERVADKRCSSACCWPKDGHG